MTLRAEVIAIGDEMTSGVRLDTNTQWISQRLGDIGIKVAFHSTVGDDLKDNIDVFRIAAERADVIVMTGGLGPTADDLTRHAIAKMAGVELVLNEKVLEHIRQMYSKRSIEMPSNNEVQAWFPEGTQVIDNPEGTAPGIDFAGTIDGGAINSGESSYRIFALPGVPVEMNEDFVIHHHTVHCFGAGESYIETLLPDLVKRGRDPSVGITASSATISLRVSTRAKTIELCVEKMKPTIATIHECLGDLVFGENGISLEQVVVKQLLKLGQKIAVSDFGLKGAVAQAIGAVDEQNSVLIHSTTGRDEGEKSIKDQACLLVEESDSDWGVVVSAINRDEKLIAARKSVYSVVIANRTGDAVEKEIYYSGHSGWREIRAVKEVLNFVRLHLQSNS